MKKYYAIYTAEVENCTFDSFAEFETEQERDDWVNQQEAFDREPLADLDFLGLDLIDYTRVPDEVLSNVFWLQRITKI